MRLPTGTCTPCLVYFLLSPQLMPLLFSRSRYWVIYLSVPVIFIEFTFDPGLSLLRTHQWVSFLWNKVLPNGIQSFS